MSKRIIPGSVCPKIAVSLNRNKNSKSGTILPAIKPVIDNRCLLEFQNGKTIAGCENVNGINKNSLIVGKKITVQKKTHHSLE
jgi:hypothetical protein